MGQQSLRQTARREVMVALTARRRERAEQEKRLEDLGVQVATALKERDAAVTAAELRAGEALRTMTEDEGLSMREALIWSGQPVTVREGTRLMRVAGMPEAVLPSGGQDGLSESAGREVTCETAGRVPTGGSGVGPLDQAGERAGSKASAAP